MTVLLFFFNVTSCSRVCITFKLNTYHDWSAYQGRTKSEQLWHNLLPQRPKTSQVKPPEFNIQHLHSTPQTQLPLTLAFSYFHIHRDPVCPTTVLAGSSSTSFQQAEALWSSLHVKYLSNKAFHTRWGTRWYDEIVSTPTSFCYPPVDQEEKCKGK